MKKTTDKCQKCPGGFRTPEPFDYYIKVATEAVGRSNLLWIAVNRVILANLKNAKANGRSLDYVADTLEGLVGKRGKKNEPASLSNIRVTIKALRNKTDLVLL